MLTRLKVKGFKNLVDVTVDFGPYTCIAGPNATGKSNLFDAIEFLSLLADLPFLDAVREVRPAGSRAPDPATLFTLGPEGKPLRTIEIEAEMLVSPYVVDDFGNTGAPRSTFLKYSIELRHVPNDSQTPGKRLSGVELVSESLVHINKRDAKARLPWMPKSVLDAVVQNQRTGAPYVSTADDPENGRLVRIHAEGGSRGKPLRTPVHGTRRTVISGINSAEDPTILAARQEMRDWRKLALEPTAMRTPDDLYTPAQTVSANGARMAAALWRLENDDADITSQVTNNLTELTDVREVTVTPDESRETLSLEARLGTGPLFPARSLSEGTLRFLALSVIEVDPQFHGLICMEEPENGIHPAKIPAMVELLKRLAVDSSEPPSDDNPLRQVAVNTHSPEFVGQQDSADLLITWPVTHNIGGAIVNGVAFAPIRGSWRASMHSDLPAAWQRQVESYLKDPRDAPLARQVPLPGLEEVAA